MSGAQHTEQSSGSMPSLRRIPALALVAAAALPAAGCEDGGPAARARDGRVTVTLDDFSIAPQRIRASPGRLEFRAVNRGAIGHTLRVMRAHPPQRELVAVKTLLPGGSGTGAGTLERGEYDLVCILGNHEELGMYGTLTVR
jgi:plastocyanin